MKVSLYYVSIIYLLIIGSSIVTQATGMDPEDRQNSHKILKFTNVTKNLTLNENDSVYPQIASSSNNVYVVWQESVKTKGSRNYDIFFKKSNDSGNIFGSPVNLSNNNGFSEHPQIACVGNHIYVVWVDNSSGARKVMFTKSSDSGNTFTNNIVLSQDSIDPYHVEVAAEGKNVYVIWNSLYTQMLNKVLLSKSDDAGKTFGELTVVGTADVNTFPKIAADAGRYYISWDKKNNKDTGITFVKSSMHNSTYNDTSISILNNEGTDGGESQIFASDRMVLVSWTSKLPIDKKYVYIKSSENNGDDFGNTIQLPSTNSSNVESLIFNNNIYVVWEDNVSGNHDIFLIKARVNETSFDKPVNVSDNSGISECPSVTVSKNVIHVVWEDNTLANHEILYKRVTENF